MRGKFKLILAVGLALLLAVTLAACRQETAKHPLVAIWSQDLDEGKTRVMFSFEAVGDVEMVVWRYDPEADDLLESETWIGDYSVNEEDSSVTLRMKSEDGAEREETYFYQVSQDALSLKNEAREYRLSRSGENTARTK